MIPVVVLLMLSACGSAVPTFADDVPTQTYPVVSRIEPTSGPAGTAIDVYGIGFSAASPSNVVIIGNAGSSATDYQLLPNPTSDEVEVITAEVAVDAAVGQSPVLVLVHENPSNVDVMFDVTP